MKDGPPGFKTWMQLRSIGNSQIVQASALFPIVGYLILFNDQVSTFLSMTGFEQARPSYGLFAWIWAKKIHLIYFGLASFGIGSLVYSACCPFIIRKHGDFADYVRIDGPSISDHAVVEYAKRMGITNPTFLSETQALMRRKSDILHQWYAMQSAQGRPARDVVFVLFAVGSVLVSIPSILSAIKIGGLLLGF